MMYHLAKILLSIVNKCLTASALGDATVPDKTVVYGNASVYCDVCKNQHYKEDVVLTACDCAETAIAKRNALRKMATIVRRRLQCGEIGGTE